MSGKCGVIFTIIRPFFLFVKKHPVYRNVPSFTITTIDVT